jgi:hypothetical protein
MFNSLLNGHAWPYFRPTFGPDDKLNGGWSREELEAMDARFVAALEVAFHSGQEQRNSAAAEFRGAKKGSAELARQRAGQLVEAAQSGELRNSGLF